MLNIGYNNVRIMIVCSLKDKEIEHSKHIIAKKGMVVYQIRRDGVAMIYGKRH